MPRVYHSYHFAATQISGIPLVLMIDKADGGPAPAAITRQFQFTLRTLEGGRHGEIIPVYVGDQLSSFHRKRLVDLKVPFIIPGNQLYLPMLGLDLREHFRQLQQSRQTFSPSTQLAVLSILLQPSTGEVTPSELAQRLGYSKMTLTRVFNELEGSQIVQIEQRGRERCLTAPEDRKSLWYAAQPFLESPVRWRYFVTQRAINDAPLVAAPPTAGVTALAHYSMISAPPIPEVALSSPEWRRLTTRKHLTPQAEPEPDAVAVEVWWYDPAKLANGGVVDPLSLSLSFQQSEDERIEAAVEEMIQGMQW